MNASKHIALSALPLLLAAQTLGGCDDHHDDAAFTDRCGEPQYAGGTTDEAWKAIVDAYDQAAVGSASAVTITQPAPNAVIASAGAAPTFVWTSPLAAGPSQPRAIASAATHHENASETSWLDDALAAVGGFFVGAARAHLPPITGDVYYVELEVAGRECPVARALTTDETWVPDAAVWAELKTAEGVPIEIVVTSVYLTENRITEGPFRPATSVVFEVE